MEILAMILINSIVVLSLLFWVVLPFALYAIAKFISMYFFQTKWFINE
jgi:hypothetical protein